MAGPGAGVGQPGAQQVQLRSPSDERIRRGHAGEYHRCGTGLRTSTDVRGRRRREGLRMNLSTAVDRLFTPARRPGRIGAEVELIPVTDTTRPRPVDPRVLAAGFDPAFVAAAAPTFEPGGQLELSPAPRPTVRALLADLETL